MVKFQAAVGSCAALRFFGTALGVKVSAGFIICLSGLRHVPDGNEHRVFGGHHGPDRSSARGYPSIFGCVVSIVRARRTHHRDLRIPKRAYGLAGIRKNETTAYAQASPGTSAHVNRQLGSVSRMSREVSQRPDLLVGRSGKSTNVHRTPLTFEFVASQLARPELVSMSSYHSVSRS